MRYITLVLFSFFSWIVGANQLWAQHEPLTHQDDMACPHCRHQALERQVSTVGVASAVHKSPRAFAPVTTFRTGQIVRLKSMRERYLYEQPNHTAKTTKNAPEDASLWVLEAVGQGYSLRNVGTGNFLQSVSKDNTSLPIALRATVFYIRKSSKQAGKYQLSWKQDFSGKECLHEDGSSRAVRWSAGDNDLYSNWSIEEVTELNEAEVRNKILQQKGYVSSITSGKVYRLTSAAYGDRVLNVDYFSGAVTTAPYDANALSQLWTLERDGQNWKVRSLVSEEYIQNQASRSTPYRTGSRSFSFRLEQGQEYLPSFAFGGTFFLHTDQQDVLVSWYNDQPASRWHLQEVEPDAVALAKLKEEVAASREMANSAATHTSNLSRFFTDHSCTQLQEKYANVSDQELMDVMQRTGIPLLLQQMAVRVKNAQWSTHPDANRLEKNFRIANYKAYSDHRLWHEPRLVGTGFAFSRLTSPTGITLDAGKTAFLFVSQAVPQGCSLKAELVKDFDTTGQQIDLKPGLNVVSTLEPAHIYIYYNVDNVNMKLAACPDITIHIEGGRVNGYFDSNRHSNADWTMMKKLSAHGFLKDPTLRLKSTYYCMSLHLDQAKASESNGAWSYNGTYKGLTGILGKMDEINKMERELIGADQFYDRFNCMHFASSNGQHDFLYATTYGIFLKNAGTFLNYKTYAQGSDNYGGGDLWAVAHETGHHFQRLFNLTVCVESSVNLFSNIAVFNQGSNVSRGPSMLHFVDQFNKNVSWIDRKLADRILPYYQLWLYFEHLGHHPRFYKDLCDKFRKSQIVMGNADTDYLKFARTVCDVVKEDLTEFFEFHGFLNKTKIGNQNMTWGDDFYDRYYGPKPITISASAIDATRRHMAKYPKKGARNLLFIDDRIRKSAATFEGAKAGQMRWGTTQGVVPGVPNSVGEVGMYHDFAKDASTATISEVALKDRTIKVKGTAIVGYKVYDAHNRLVFVSNKNTFTLPTTLDLNTVVVKVGAGNGDEIVVIEGGKVLEKFTVTGIVDSQIDAPHSSSPTPESPTYDLAGRRVNPTQSGIYIQNGQIKLKR